jgi:peptidoglycan/xylan/chitin deacetylase (PgdA/CDA1 family)
MIQYLDANGWEIGVHGSYLSYVNKRLLKKEKDLLEKILGHKVYGIRQHYLNMNNKTWQIQKECGFNYDTSFGFTDEIGFKEEKYTPFKPMNDDFIVFPQIIMDICFMSTRNKWDRLEEIINICKEKNSILVINWHQRVFNDKEFPGYKEAYINIISILKANGAEFYKLIDLLN